MLSLKIVMQRYNPKKIEGKWQKKWYDSDAFSAKNRSKKKKFYLLVEFPYPSGDGLHVGHCRSYTALDIIARKRRMYLRQRKVFRHYKERLTPYFPRQAPGKKGDAVFTSLTEVFPPILGIFPSLKIISIPSTLFRTSKPSKPSFAGWTVFSLISRNFLLN